MAPAPGIPEKIAEDIYRIPIPLPNSPLEAVNAYLIRGPRNLVVDTGMRQTECMEAMRRGLDSLGVDLRDTDFFITHFHADHLGLVSELAGPASTIYLNGPDATRILGGSFRQRFEASVRLNGFPEEEIADAMAVHPGSKFGPRLPLAFAQPGGGRIDVGDCKLRCIETPGHSFGHTCLYEPDRKILISGDHILADITPHIEAWYDDWDPLDQYLKSLDKIATVDIALVLPGHRDPFRDAHGRVKELEAHHAARTEEVLSILLRGPATAYQVASEMTWDIACDSFALFPLTQRWFALGEAIAHLRYMESLSRSRHDIIERQGRAVAVWTAAV
jgi:glyoxylase-like metal-dependent hydrolase (beta-lactamase superfamily II)